MNSNENQSPLPQPMRNTCSNCGFGWNENTPFCPRCGAKLTQDKRPLSLFAQIMLGVTSIVIASIGACFGMLGVIGGGGFWYLALGVVLLVAAFLLGRLVSGNEK